MKEKEQEASLNVVSCVDMAESCINIGIDAMAEAKDIEGVIAAAMFSIAYSMVAMNKMKMEEMETVKAEVEGRAVNVIEDTIALPKEQEGYVSVPFSWLVKFCTHIDFVEPLTDAEREVAWRQKLRQQFGINASKKGR